MASYPSQNESPEQIFHRGSEPTTDTQDITDLSDVDSTFDTDSNAETDSTIETDDLGDYFRIAHGRTFPGFEELPMALPADVEEIHRLRIQHRSLELLLASTLNPIMIRFLAPLPDRQRKSILDIRTQAGLWAEQTAIRFPHVDVKTIDVAPTVPHTPRANLFHEVYDTHLGILEVDGSFDMVHARSSVTMMKDWRKMLKEIHRVLRPGGMFVFNEIEPRLTSPGERESDSLARTSRSARFFDKFRSAVMQNGILIESCREIDSWLRPDDPLWASEPGSGFRDITHWEWETPTNGLWHPDPMMQEIGRMSVINTTKFFHSARPLFLSTGVSEQDFASWVADSIRELHDPTHISVIRTHLVCACKL